MLTNNERQLMILIQNSTIVPTRRQMARALGFRSATQIQHLVDLLVARGYLRRLRQKQQALEVIRRVPAGIAYYVFDESEKCLRLMRQEAAE